MRKLALIFAGALVFAMFPVFTAQADAQGTGTVSVTVPSATTLTMVNGTCALGNVNPGTDTRGSGGTANCVTYIVNSNDPSGSSVSLGGGAKPAFSGGISYGFYIRRNGQSTWNALADADTQSAGAKSGTKWQDETSLGPFSYGDDFAVNVSASQQPVTFSQTLTYTVTGK